MNIHQKEKRLITAADICMCAVLFLVMLLPCYAEAASVYVYASKPATPPLEAIAFETVLRLNRTFTELGRFMPVEANKVVAARTQGESDVRSNPDENTAARLKTDITVSIDFYQQGETVYAVMNVVPLDPHYAALKRSVSVKSRITANVPLKLAREIVQIHQNLPLDFSVTQKYADGTANIDAGQWNGPFPRDIPFEKRRKS